MYTKEVSGDTCETLVVTPFDMCSKVKHMQKLCQGAGRRWGVGGSHTLKNKIACPSSSRRVLSAKTMWGL